MKIPYPSRSKFSAVIERMIDENRETLLNGNSIDTNLGGSGYPGTFTIVIDKQDKSYFDAVDYFSEDRTRFPARIRGGAKALLNKSCFGRFKISNSQGIIAIQALQNIVHPIIGSKDPPVSEKNEHSIMCDSAKPCWATVNNKTENPVVFAKEKSFKIMVITEQPNEYFDINDMSKIKKNSICYPLDRLFDGKFISSVTDNQSSLFYWTHWIKCPGQIRRTKSKSFNSKCADVWMKHEIQQIKPEYIITIGKNASSWILKYYNIRKDWMFNILNSELEMAYCKKQLYWQEKDGKKIFVLPHPIGRNPLGKFVFKNIKLKKAFKRFLLNI